MAKQTFFGFQHAYGSNMIDERGDYIGSVSEFTTAEARDRWIDSGNPFVNDPGARTALEPRGGARADHRAIRNYRLYGRHA